MEFNKTAYKMHKESGTLKKYRSHLIERLKARKYSPGAEIDLINDKDSQPTEYAEYQAYRAECKATVDKWFAEMEQGG